MRQKNQFHVVEITFMIAVATVVKRLHLDVTPVKKLQLTVSIQRPLLSFHCFQIWFLKTYAADMLLCN